MSAQADCWPSTLGMLPIRENLHQLCLFPLAHIQGTSCPTGSMAKTTFNLAPYFCQQPFNAIPQSSALLNPPSVLTSRWGRCKTYPHLLAVKTTFWKALPLCDFRYFLTRTPSFVPHKRWFCITDARAHAINPEFRELSGEVLEQIQGHVLGSMESASLWHLASAPTSCFILPRG